MDIKKKAEEVGTVAIGVVLAEFAMPVLKELETEVKKYLKKYNKEEK